MTLPLLTRAAMVGLIFTTAFASAASAAAELSIVSGLYRSEKHKADGDDAGEESTIDIGGRFADLFDTRSQWFGQGLLTLKSYEAGKGQKAPSDSTSLSLGGGLRYYFNKMAEHVTPYVEGGGNFRNSKTASEDTNTVVEKEQNGLFYGAAAGMRFGVDANYFFDVQTALFESALFATDTTETSVTANGQTTKVKRETTRTDLYVNTTGAFAQVLVALGVRF